MHIVWHAVLAQNEMYHTCMTCVHCGYTNIECQKNPDMKEKKKRPHECMSLCVFYFDSSSRTSSNKIRNRLVVGAEAACETAWLLNEMYHTCMTCVHYGYININYKWNDNYIYKRLYLFVKKATHKSRVCEGTAILMALDAIMNGGAIINATHENSLQMLYLDAFKKLKTKIYKKKYMYALDTFSSRVCLHWGHWQLESSCLIERPAVYKKSDTMRC